MTTPIPFSTALRERSSGAHSGSESAGFMADLLKGEGTREDYVALVAQHWFIYEALEGAADRMRRDPVASVFISDKLTRLPALEADLAFLIGDDWTQRITPLPTTERYVARIRQVGATWAGGFVAHHYTRYLGDLSGGLFIGKLMARRFGFETNGIGFYIFGDIADPKAFKDVYREQLDAAPWDEAEKQRVIDEVLLAYRFNTELFDDLARAKADAAA
ncbi:MULTISPECIES: biliverdin-producing heme oxygenase [Microbacterium]|jgi:heme oxygenase (biliverdin-producing, ferredoxin)|uniref:biliverdin-producing heme oxygenase n=2 Tax=Microbacteriaceae TaxID=85023 RepID=UPI0006FF8B6B|nr:MULTISPECIES: biliverdin-producing heme oxygenase [unclassified Microbacterium]MBN9197556.1 biliverdin-producing heme oxygenase [Microbacterium ginsengisoli]MCK9919927.1 biliverdin-producing heme oxygenase [Microbacteriaceae bacterium K1510]KQS01613.1 heme oxygenase [Microbacterium sp. Leaf347]ODU77766.1 MAG: heme oxygenase [Microbacterium sp. SCN 71-21]OJU79561.1 MAG: biliverdin-producing heme oxygenase [Microbacterium sp. 71-23]